METKEIEKQKEKENGSLTHEEVMEMKNSTKKTWKKTPYLEEKILGWLADGKTKKRAAELSGITEQTLYNWLKADDIFKQRVENAMGGTITLRAIDTVAEEVRLGNVEAAKWWIKNTKAFDKRYDPKLAENKMEPNPVTGVFEIVEPESIAGSLLGPELSEDIDEEDLEAALYAQDPDIE